MVQGIETIRDLNELKDLMVDALIEFDTTQSASRDVLDWLLTFDVDNAEMSIREAVVDIIPTHCASIKIIGVDATATIELNCDGICVGFHDDDRPEPLKFCGFTVCPRLLLGVGSDPNLMVSELFQCWLDQVRQIT